MQSVSIKIRLGNDAMQTPLDVAKALMHLALKLETNSEISEVEDLAIIDINGNRVGEMKIR